MNTTTRGTIAALAMVTALGWTGAADASTPRGPGTSADDRASTGAYAERLDALRGTTMAQYLAVHMERRLS